MCVCMCVYMETIYTLYSVLSLSFSLYSLYSLYSLSLSLSPSASSLHSAPTFSFLHSGTPDTHAPWSRRPRQGP